MRGDLITEYSREGLLCVECIVGVFFTSSFEYCFYFIDGETSQECLNNFLYLDHSIFELKPPHSEFSHLDPIGSSFNQVHWHLYFGILLMLS